MAGTTLTTTIRKRLYSFTKSASPDPSATPDGVGSLGTWFDGLISAGHVHLTAIARGDEHAVSATFTPPRSDSVGNLSSEHWNAAPLATELLRRSAALVGDDTLIVADTTDLAKPYARHLEGLGRVHDGSDPDMVESARGYCVFEAYVRVGQWQLFPLVSRTAEDLFRRADRRERRDSAATCCESTRRPAERARGCWIAASTGGSCSARW